jgi:hypothetical protein
MLLKKFHLIFRHPLHSHNLLQCLIFLLSVGLTSLSPRRIGDALGLFQEHIQLLYLFLLRLPNQSLKKMDAGQVHSRHLRHFQVWFSDFYPITNTKY